MQNPLIARENNLPFGAIPFDQIKKEHFLPAFDYWMEETTKRIDQIKNTAKTNFENTIVALEFSTLELNELSVLFFNLYSADTSDALEEIAQVISPRLSLFSTSIFTDTGLFGKIKQIKDNTAHTLKGEDLILLQETYKNFERNGALLNTEEKQKFQDISEKLSVLSLEFGKNVLEETNNFELWLTDEKDLIGLPESVQAAAKEAAIAKKRAKDWLFTLHAPSYLPFMTYSSARSLRKKMFKAMGTRACKADDRDNQKIVLETVELRRKIAEILGYPHYDAYVLSDRMAENLENVQKLENELLQIALPIAQEEVKMIEKYAKDLDQIDTLQRWDFAYYSEKLKKEKFDIDDTILRPYFSLDKTLTGLFALAKKLFGITLKERKDLPKYHPDVLIYEVLDEKENFLALFYADLFPRESKRAGAWMTSFKEQYQKEGIDHRPQVSIVCNFTKPTQDQPSLLDFNEITTLFHEFGHSLHGMLAQGKYPSLTGTHVKWDFVEFPSQLMENWCYEKEVLDLFAVHYKTGEKIPAIYIQKIKESANFLSAYQMCRQIGMSTLDLAWHSLTQANSTTTVFDFEKKILATSNLLPILENTSISTTFSHIFQGEYAAGYYSYKWAEVLEADAYAYISESGVLNNVISSKLKETILSKGASEKPMELYLKFRGILPKIDALLKRSGLKKN